MKTLFTSDDGKINLAEEAGKITLSVDEAMGGGEAAGIVTGKASVVFDGPTALKLGEQLLNSHLPPVMQPVAQIVEGIANQAIEAME